MTFTLTEDELRGLIHDHLEKIRIDINAIIRNPHAGKAITTRNVDQIVIHTPFIIEIKR